MATAMTLTKEFIVVFVNPKNPSEKKEFCLLADNYQEAIDGAKNMLFWNLPFAAATWTLQKVEQIIKSTD